MSISCQLCEVPIGPNDQKSYGGLNIFSPVVRQQSLDLFSLCKQYGEIHPNSSVLDYGCGTGRILSHLSGYCKNAIGFDICDRFLKYCRQYNLKTFLGDTYHPEFNPNGSKTKQTLPFDDKIFDRVIGIALLNHQDMKNTTQIIKEALRVTKKGGIILFTAFLLNSQSKTQLQFNNVTIPFTEHTDEWWVVNHNRPYLNCALDEFIIRRIVLENNGQVVEPIYYGQWRNLPAPTGHDLLIIRKL